MSRLVAKIFIAIFFSYILSTNANANWWNDIDSPSWLKPAENSSAFKGIKISGDILQFAPLAIAVGLVLYNEDAQIHRTKSYKDFVYEDDGLLQLIATTGTSVATANILKVAVGRPRPRDYYRGQAWFHGSRSFPSGHTAMAFSPAFFIAKRYGWSCGIPALMIATYVGYSRVAINAHYITDVTFAAGLSALFAYIFTRPYKIGKAVVTVGSSSFGNGVGVNVVW